MGAVIGMYKESDLLTDDELLDLELELTDKELLFCERYVKHLVQRRAAIEAGYSEKSGAVDANRILKKHNVQLYIAHLNAIKMQAVRVDVQSVVQELAKMGFAKMSDFLEEVKPGTNMWRLKPLHKIDHPEAIKKIELGILGNVEKIELHDKTKSLELLGRHLAMFTDNVNLDAKVETEQTITNVLQFSINHRSAGETINKQLTDGNQEQIEDIDFEEQ